MKKRGAIYSVAALMLCAAVYLNWYYTQDGDQAEAADKKEGKVLGESILVDNVSPGRRGRTAAPPPSPGRNTSPRPVSPASRPGTKP